MSSSNQQNQTLAALGLSGNTRGAPKVLEVFALNTNDPFAHLQSAQLLQRSGADPILWTGTELTRSTPAGNFRLYKDASNGFGIWVPNSQAFYSDGIPPNISAPDILSGQMVGGSYADRTEPVRHYPAYGHSSDYRRNDRVFTNSSHRKNRATPYDRPAGYKQYQYSNTPSEQYNRDDESASRRSTASSRYTVDASASLSTLRQGREQSSKAATSHRPSHFSSSYKRGRQTSSITTVTPLLIGRNPVHGLALTPEQQQRRTLLNQKRRERRKQVMMAVKSREEEQQT
ncbi:unnamed protein product [Didymodactylos carnosus]|uniref:Uncharacterized protein n=1 Tax=Didymodactylos carnosus TaxID=1234261 RepID=A0A8S2THI9_9BILA|nr:unnamed protein product [Didymodactylos carnosus]CAF4288008.1 unnamed protein product [Didymodactylos carnosus]